MAAQAKFGLNSRQANDAVHDAQATISSQKELLKLNHANAKKRVEFTQKRLEKAKSPGKRVRLQRRLEIERDLKTAELSCCGRISGYSCRGGGGNR